MKRTYNNPDTMKAVAVWKSNHPGATIAELAERFNIKPHQVRYALDKYAEDANLMKNTRAGRKAVASALIGNGSPERPADESSLELLNNQLALILAQLECDDAMPVMARVQALNTATRVKRLLQSMTLQHHLKRLDADIIAAIIRRYNPNVSDTEIIEIYNEELANLRAGKEG